jgi:hypothetical protein
VSLQGGGDSEMLALAFQSNPAPSLTPTSHDTLTTTSMLV